MSGTNTDFLTYSSQLKSRLDITQVQLNNLAVVFDSGKLLGFLSGIAASYLPLWPVSGSLILKRKKVGFRDGLRALLPGPKITGREVRITDLTVGFQGCFMHQRSR